MYDGVVMTMRTTCKATGEFLVTIGLHQGSLLSRPLFTRIVEELTAQCSHSREITLMYCLQMI